MLVVFISLFRVTVCEAQSSARFGTCAYWQDQKAKKPTELDSTSYRVGLAHGFVLGILGDLPRESYSDPKWAMLDNQYGKGLVEVLQRPAVLVDAFDQKCGDYRNRGVTLSNVGTLVILEIAGVPASGVEKALEILRGGGDEERAIQALIDSR
jgi:hypothetical protein